MITFKNNVDHETGKVLGLKVSIMIPVEVSEKHPETNNFKERQQSIETFNFCRSPKKAAAIVGLE